MSSPNLNPGSGPRSGEGTDLAAAEIWESVQRVLDAGGAAGVSDEAVQQLMSAAVKLFAAKIEAEDRFFSPLLGRGDVVTPTEAVVAVSEILRAVNLNTFDLAMWFNRSRPER